MASVRHSSFASIIHRKSLERAQSWLKPNLSIRTSLKHSNNLILNLDPQSLKRAEQLIETYSLRNDTDALTLIILHLLPQSPVTSTHLALFLRFSKGPQYESLTGPEIATIHQYLKQKPQNYYNPWKHLLDRTGTKPLPQKQQPHPTRPKATKAETLQRLLAQLEPAKHYADCVRAHRNLMYNSQLITDGFATLLSTFSFCEGGWGVEADGDDRAEYEGVCGGIEEGLLRRRLLEASGEERGEDFWIAGEWSARLGHPALRRRGCLGGGEG